MPNVGQSFTAKGGTVFAWQPDDPDAGIEIIVPDDSLSLGNISKRTWCIDIPTADLDEFVAHIVSEAAEGTLGRVLLFPCLRPSKSAPEPEPPKDAA